MHIITINCCSFAAADHIRLGGGILHGTPCSKNRYQQHHDVLSLALIKVIVKGKFFDCKIKTVEQFHDAIWNNAHEFIFFDRPDFSCSENKLLYSV